MGSTIPSILGFIIANSLFDKMKFPLIIGVALFVLCGFLAGDFLTDGFADGGQNG